MTFVTSRLEGGLGNFLFQIAAGYSFAIKHDKQYFLDSNYIQSGHTSFRDYKTNIFKNINYKKVLEQFLVYKEPNFLYTPIKVDTAQNIFLNGYFQSEKYFVDNKNKINELFLLNEEDKDFLNKKYKNILSNFNTCSLHVRRGDYLNKQHAHVILPLEYYIKSTSVFNQDMHYLIFSDDINWCKQSFNFIKNKTFVIDNKDYQDLYLMSLCNNNIIANSSFSWWGAWLNLACNKTVIAPKTWFNTNYISKHDDIYCKNWLII